MPGAVRSWMLRATCLQRAKVGHEHAWGLMRLKRGDVIQALGPYCHCSSELKADPLVTAFWGVYFLGGLKESSTDVRLSPQIPSVGIALGPTVLTDSVQRGMETSRLSPQWPRRGEGPRSDAQRDNTSYLHAQNTCQPWRERQSGTCDRTGGPSTTSRCVQEAGHEQLVLDHSAQLSRLEQTVTETEGRLGVARGWGSRVMGRCRWMRSEFLFGVTKTRLEIDVAMAVPHGEWNCHR